MNTIIFSDEIWTWGHFFFGLTYAIIASLIFLFIVLWLFKPKIRIAPIIAKLKNFSESDQIYIFKFVNKSFFAAHDLKVELHQVRKIPMGAGKFNNEYKRLTLCNGEISHISGKPFWTKKEVNPHCITVRTKEDLYKILSDETKAITIRIGLRHGLTGLSKVFDHEFGSEGSIQIGRFKPAAKFGIIN